VAGHAAPAQIYLKKTYLSNCINAEAGYSCLHPPSLDLLCNEWKRAKLNPWNAARHQAVGETMGMDMAGAEALCLGFLHGKRVNG